MIVLDRPDAGESGSGVVAETTHDMLLMPGRGAAQPGGNLSPSKPIRVNRMVISSP
jgi:hypothetical protein